MAYLMACPIRFRKIWPSYCHPSLHDSNVVIVHWISDFTHLNTPSTKQVHKPFNLRLKPCTGCALDDNTLTTAQRRSPSQQSWSCCFRCPIDCLFPISDGPKRLNK